MQFIYITLIYRGKTAISSFIYLLIKECSQKYLIYYFFSFPQLYLYLSDLFHPIRLAYKCMRSVHFPSLLRLLLITKFSTSYLTYSVLSFLILFLFSPVYLHFTTAYSCYNTFSPFFPFIIFIWFIFFL